MTQKNSSETAQDIWIVVQVKNETFGLPATLVREMVRVPNITRVPTMPKQVRGTINLRGTILPLLDLRIILGFESAQEESEALVKNLKQREQDHRNWIGELEKSTREGREFKLTTDPTQCAFGKWFYSFKSESLLLKSLLKRFEEPHREIHNLGVTVKALVAQQRSEDALRLIEEARQGTLQSLLQLFEDLYRQVSSNDREIALIVDTQHGRMALVVDAVVSVEMLSNDGIDETEAVFGRKMSHCVAGIGRRRNNQGLALLLNPDLVFSTGK